VPSILLTQAIIHVADGQRLPEGVEQWVTALRGSVVRISSADDVVEICLRSRPRLVVLDARATNATRAHNALNRIKGDAYTAVTPCVMIVDGGDRAIEASFEDGADEVLSASQSDIELRSRLTAALRRSERDVRVHPSTRLPGASEIDGEIARRMGLGESFAACYADIDHFKEFNDRYSYHQGDRIIRVVSQILHDVVKGICPRTGFVGHIGGDDFIFVIPIEHVREVCEEVISVFDALMPLQYSEQDRLSGYFVGKDRRGQMHRVPLMTVSIGVVTTERRRFTHAAQVSALATEMKSYAKTISGSVFSIDRRQDDAISIEPSASIQAVALTTREGGTS
jgi:diguanylate cyclase (GGDEF)-like protein